MIEQYLEIKRQNSDAILLFRLGDFYEMFFEDARTASRELEIVLTARDGGAKKIPMCGVPYHSVNNYIIKLINRGYKVAICEQVEDPKKATGIVKREITRIITPGTVLDDLMLDESKNNYLAAIIEEKNILGLSYIDISTGDFCLTELNGNNAYVNLANEMDRIAPSECLVPKYSSFSLWNIEEEILLDEIDESALKLETAETVLKEQFNIESLDAFGLKGCSTGLKAAAAIVNFLFNTQKSKLKQVQKIRYYSSETYMELDQATRKNLELTVSIRDGKKEGTLLEVIDNCYTAMGKRNLRRWLEQPLLSLEKIEKRLDAVQELKDNLELREESKSLLGQVYDIERLAGKLGGGIATPRDLIALKKSLTVLPELKNLYGNCSSSLLQELAEMDKLDDIHNIIEISILEDAPLTLKEGGIIKNSYWAEIDELKKMSLDGKNWLLNFELSEKERTGIKHLKVGFNKVFGYYIEISKSNLSMVPAEYIRKQTLVNTERYITEELKKYENNILGARERLNELEYDCFLEIRNTLEKEILRIQETASALASIDTLNSLAQVAYDNDYIRPELSEDGDIDIKAGRHPVVEKYLKNTRFVPNDLKMNMDKLSFAIITGPNMGGKSTYMRQAAVIVIMAQMGSFVPADYAKLGIVDRVFTRVGAADDLSSGQSTFMVEMLELANIINNASSKSLLILDEIGRGTSTFDGLSIAQAVSEFIHDTVKAKTLFATHYHELTELADNYDRIYNLSVSVMESGESVSFLKKVLPGKADKSYGIHVARLAGLPKAVIQRADEILIELENEKNKVDNYKNEKQNCQVKQLNLFEEEQNYIIKELEKIDLDSISPKEALDTLYRWKSGK